MKPIILVNENIPLLAEAIEPATRDAWKVVHYSGRYLPAERMPHADALFVRSVTRVDESVLEGMPVVFVGTATSGYEHVDTEYLRRQNIHFADAPGCNANSVAEYVLYSMLRWADVRSVGLAGLTLGIVGYGHIGKLVAVYAQRLGMKVLVNDPPLKDRRYAFSEGLEYVEFTELLHRADVVTNHVPFRREGKYATVGLFGEREFAAMKHGSLFIHTSRRFVALEIELLPFLRDGRLFAAIDVWEQEPRLNKELADRALIATPHTAGYSFEGKIRGSLVMAERFATFFGIQPDMSIFERAFEHSDRPDVNYTDQQQMYDLLRTSRRLDEDTDMLRETLAAPEFQHPTLFDKLRKNYPRRREILFA